MVTYRQPFKNEWPITQGYGEKITSSFHTGIDYGCPLNTPILSSADGQIVFAAWDETGYGNLVIIEHKDGNATCYAHLSDVSVKIWQNVRQGELIGHSGSSGNSTGPHLHFEARKFWNDYKSHFDPMNLPLTTVDDLIPQIGLLNAADLKIGDVVISCPAGAYGHNTKFNDKWTFRSGTEMRFTGNSVKRGELEFCECEMKLFVAVNDGETQILKNT